MDFILVAYLLLTCVAFFGLSTLPAFVPGPIPRVVRILLQANGFNSAISLVMMYMLAGPENRLESFATVINIVQWAVLLHILTVLLITLAYALLVKNYLPLILLVVFSAVVMVLSPGSSPHPELPPIPAFISFGNFLFLCAGSFLLSTVYEFYIRRK